MNKKRKYIPGWQLQKRQEDRENIEKSTAIMQKYYEQQKVERQLEEIRNQQKRIEEEVKKAQEYEAEKNRTDLHEEKNVKQTPITEKKESTIKGGYATESAQSYLNRTADPTAFWDQNIPSILDPKYNEWAIRQTARSIQTGDTMSPVSIAARAAVNLQANFVEDYIKGKEDVAQRFNRRIFESNLGFLNKDKDLTSDEVNEIIAFKTITDPKWGWDRIDQLHKELEEQERQERLQNPLISEPEDYLQKEIEGVTNQEFGWTQPMGMTYAQPYGGTLGNSVAKYIKSQYNKSFLSDFILRTNESQMKVGEGQIQRSKEFVDMSDKTYQNLDLIERYANNLAQLRRFDTENYWNKQVLEGKPVLIPGQLGGLTLEQQQLYEKLLFENREIRNQLEENEWWKNANNLASWAPTKTGLIFNLVDKVIDDDIGGVRVGLFGLDNKLDDLQKLLQSNDHNEKWLENITGKIGNIKKQLVEFNATNAELQHKWRSQMATDIQDLIDWRSGNNWMGLKAQVDPYYEQQKSLLEKGGFKILNDPIEAAQFGFAGVAGGSNSSWWKSIISLSSKVAGAAAAIGTGGGASLFQAGMIATSFEADKSAGSDENNIESADRVSQLVSQKLQHDELYDEFIKEGLEQLRNKEIDGVKLYEHIKNLNDEERDDFIKDTFLSGVWHSKNPKITKIHADAVIGSNHQFYSNQPVNTADAAIGSIADIASLSTVKYLARATKVVGSATAEKAAQMLNKVVPEKVGLKFAGFKKGIHNSDLFTGGAQIAGQIGKTVGKAPIGITAGAATGAVGGYYGSEGDIGAGVAGAIVGGAGGYFLPGLMGKGLRRTAKVLNVEDKIFDAYQRTRAFATRIPKAYLHAANIVKTGANITARLGADTASEMLQEGVQALNARGDWKNDPQFNQPLLFRVFDDFLLGAKAAWIWMNQNDPEMKSESDVWSQMNATPLLTLLGPSQVQTIIQTRRGIKTANLISTINNNIDAERRANVAELEQGAQYAKLITPEDNKRVHGLFDMYRKIAAIHRDAAEKSSSSTPEELQNQDPDYIPEEVINEQEKDYEDIYELARSRNMLFLAKLAGFLGRHGNIRSKYKNDYARLVSYEMFKRKRVAEKNEVLSEKVAEASKIFGASFVDDIVNQAYRESGIYGEEYVDTENQSEEKVNPLEKAKEFIKNKVTMPFERVRLLARVATLMQIVDDYSKLDEITPRNDVFLSEMKKRLESAKKELSELGVEINSLDEINDQMLSLEDSAYVKQLITRAFGEEALEGKTLADYFVPFFTGVLREAEMASYDKQLEDRTYKDFHNNPLHYLRMWGKRKMQDEELEKILEEDYINTIRDWEKASAREVRDGDVYYGYDGNPYIVRKVGDEYKKYRYYLRTNRIGKVPMEFDLLEYNKSKERYEEDLKKEQAVEKANKNIINGSVDDSEKIEPTEDVIVEEGPEAEETIEYAPGSYLEIEDPENGETYPAIVVKQLENEIEIESPTGEHKNVPMDSIRRYINSPIRSRKFASGSTFYNKDGKKVTVAGSRLIDVDESTMVPAYVYDVVDDNGDIVQVDESTLESQYSKEPPTSAILGEKEKIESTKEQNDMRSRLDQKFEKQKKELGDRKPTPHDYFIKIGNTIRRFIRVHGLLDPLFDESSEQKSSRRKKENELKALYEEDKEKFSKEVLNQQTEYNKKLADVFGEDSTEYEFYSIDLKTYLTGPRLRDPEIVGIIASILTSSERNPALIVGSFIDEIARDFFEGNEVVNKPKYKMSDDTFKSLISQLNDLNDRFKELKWEVYTKEFVWHGKTAQGIDFAGATDLIAIDKQGNIHILDFKTTRSPRRFKVKYEYEKDGRTVTVLDKSLIPEGVSYKVTSDFVTKLATKDNSTIEGNRTYAAQYARQLSAYRYLIQREFPGAKVISMEIVPMYVKYENDANGTVLSIGGIQLFDNINLSEIEEIQKDIDDMDNFLSSSNVNDKREQLEGAASIIQGKIDRIDEVLNSEDKEYISGNTLSTLNESLTGLLNLLKLVEKALDSSTRVSDSVYVDQLISNQEQLIKQATDAIADAEYEMAVGRDNNGPEGGHENGPEGEGDNEKKGKRAWLYEKLERVVESARQYWYQFNNLHSQSDEIKGDKDYQEAITQRDFITEGEFIITRDDKNDFDTFHVIITYKEKTFKPITIRLGNESKGKAKNYDTQGSDILYSIMGRNFLRQFYQLREIMKPGDTTRVIAASRMERTNGKLSFGEEHHNLEDTPFLEKNDSRYGSMLDGENSIIGVANDRGEIIEISDSKRTVLLSPTEDLDGNLKNPKNRDNNLPGNQGNKIPAGTVYFLYRFKNEEDPQDAPDRKVPIALKGKKLGEKNANSIINILREIAKTKSRTGAYTLMQCIDKDGNVVEGKTVPGLTFLKVLNLFTRFGQNAFYAGHEFQFDWARSEQDKDGKRKIQFDYTQIEITDTRQEPKEINGILGRELIKLDLTKPEDIEKLKDILSRVDMHINQFGKDRLKLDESTATKGVFGDLSAFFNDPENKDIQHIRLGGDLVISREDVEKGLSGIEWMIKHGNAQTNIVLDEQTGQWLSNPLISIHELEIRKKGEKGKKKPNIGEKPSRTIGAAPDDLILPNSGDNDGPTEGEGPKDKGEPVSDEFAAIMKRLEEMDGESNDELPGFPGENLIVNPEDLRPTPLTKEEKETIESRIRRLVGKVGVEWTSQAIDTLRSGAVVAGRTALSGFTLYDRIINGGEFHESFHRIFEILIPNFIRRALYDDYYKRYNESFKEENGRNLRDRDISEAFAEMFRHFMIDREPINLDKGVLNALVQIKNYIRGLYRLGNVRYAALFLAANSGIFRYVKPNAKNVEHFRDVLKGHADITLSMMKDGERKTVSLDQFPDVGGKDLFNDAVEAIIYALCTSYSVDYLARNAANINADLGSVQKLFKGKEKTEHSAWFRVLTGEYANPGDKMSVEDALLWKRNATKEELADIRKKATKALLEAKNVDKKSDKVLQAFYIQTIIQTQSNLTKEQLDPRQRMMAQLFSKEVWPFVEKKVNSRLKKMGIDSEQVTYEEYVKRFEDHDAPKGTDDTGNQIGTDIGGHGDLFFDHSRTDDATAAIRFFLSSIPDERFATEDDVKSGLVKSTTRQKKRKNGSVVEEPVMVKNRSSLMGFNVFLGMKTVSQRLLAACHKVRNAMELDNLLQQLAKEDAMFYRIAKKYHNAKENEILKWEKSGKNKITKDGLFVDEEDYEQHYDEAGVYYTWVRDGKDTGERIIGAVTQVDPDMESFVTQLFNFVACQRLDFIRVKFSQMLDEDGEPLPNSYESRVEKTSDDYAASIFPKQWFAMLRGGITGIFGMTTGGRYKFEEGGKEAFTDAIKTIKKVAKIARTNSNDSLHDKKYNLSDESDVRMLIKEYVDALNTLGIDISTEAFIYGLHRQYGNDRNLSFMLRDFVSQAERTLSHQKFEDVLDYFAEEVTETGDNKILSESRPARERASKFDKGDLGSGVNLYSDSAVIKWFASTVSAYNKESKELMTNGPEGTKRYLMAQSHTASDITDDINLATCTTDKNTPKNQREIKGSRIIRDMKNYVFNYLEKGRWSVEPIGSLIIKHILSKGNINLRLHTHGGVMIENDIQGGVAYDSITEREDWLGKAAILRDGGIIFPTLSDKSTWFYLTGVEVPGIDYSNLDAYSTDDLPVVGLYPGEKPNSSDVHLKFNWTASSLAQIDQMIEYAECEKAAIEKEINRKSWFPFIEYFNENRKRFGGLSEIYKINDKGEPELVLFNDYDPSMTPEKCLERANKEFFNLSRQEQRRRMVLTLEQGFKENLELLERTGLIKADGNVTQDKLDGNGNKLEGKVTSNKWLQYSNVGLSSFIIDKLTTKYGAVLKDSKESQATKNAKARSMAILAYTWDIYMRGVISNEETQRMYTGQLQFYKWVTGTIKDSLSGKVISCIIDAVSDFSKRLGGLGSTGEKNRTDLFGVKRTYKCAEIEDVKVASPLLKEFTKIVQLSSVKQAYLDWKESIIRKEVNEEGKPLSEDEIKLRLQDTCKYLYQENPTLDKLREEMEAGGAGLAYDVAYASGTEIADVLGPTKPADGAAFISPKMAENLLRMRGKFDGRVKQAFEYLTAGVEADGKPTNPLRSADAYKVIVDALIGTQKYSAYGYRINDATGDIPIHYYDKFALFPVFKCMATGFTSAVYDKMDEQEIDMIMMHSGVKTGSEGAVKFDPVAIQEALTKDEDGKKRPPTEKEVLQYIHDFEFHTYEQDYMFIRRQLNTDPHEKDTTTMGTQMTKVALSTVKPWNMYKVYVGETEDGEPLYEQVLGEVVIENIMDAINELSNLGKENIKEMLMNEDGTIDVDKFSAFLEDELDQRDADANLIDGVQVVERQRKRINPDTGEKETYTSREFKVELEAMSSIDWIQSIIVSKINKEVCDINVKGNAFYQRPAWGVEGRPTILDDETVDFVKRGINNGERLNEVNNDGSMDAVISLDFFYDILPSAIRDDFEKSREWLIKHKIIGSTEDVHACCINARIPTQGPASIGPLRFVDVLPVVRDTIILPSSITKIDGSDFDIDKRYLVRLSYNIKYGKSKKEGDIVSTVFDKNSEKREERINYYRNRLIQNYMALLKSHGILNKDGTMTDGDSSHTAMSSVDKDTDLVTSVRDEINSVKPKQRHYAYKFGNLAFQVMTRLKFAVGKFGIGPFALNNNNQILTQLYNVRFAKARILESLGCLSLANDKDKEGNRILSWLSGLINVHVDIAKNPDSIDGLNINKFTYNLVNLLIRTGMGRRSLLFTAQPVMTELSKVYDDAGGQFMVDLSKSKSANQKNAVDRFIYTNFGTSYGASKENVNKHMLRSKKEGENAAFEEKLGSIAQALFGIDDNGEYNSLYIEYKDAEGNWVHNKDNSYPEGAEIRKESGFLYYTLDGELIYKKGCILGDILKNQDVLLNANKEVSFDNLTDDARYKITYKDETGREREADISAKQVQEYVAYIQNSLNVYAAKLSDLVNVCKIDTKKHGKNYVEQQAYLDKYRQVFDNEDGIFEQQGLDDLRTKSYIETKTMNATQLYEDILSTFSIQATKSFKAIHDKILIKLGTTPQNKKISTKTTKAIMTHIKNRFFKAYAEQHEDPDYYRRMFYGDNKESIQGRILRLKNLIKKDKTGKYAKYGKNGVITNPLIKALQADVYEEREGFDNPQLIMLENALLDDSDTKNALERAWDEMYQDRDLVVEEDGKKVYWMRELAKDLAIYAFFTSGDQRGKTAFFDIVPNTIRLEISAEIDGELMTYNDFIRRTRENFQNEISQLEADKIAKEVIFENWNDDDFVRNIPFFVRRGENRWYQYTKTGKFIDKSFAWVRKINQKTGKFRFSPEKIKKVITSLIIGATKYDGELRESISKTNGYYPDYIKSRRPSADRRDSDNTILYELIGINSIGGSQTYPIYRIVEPTSAKMRGGTYYYNLYGLDMSEESPIFPITVKEVIKFYLHEDPVTSSQDIEEIKKEITEAFNQQVNWMADEEIKSYIYTEYELRNMSVEEEDVNDILKYIKKNLEWDNQKDKDNKSTPKKKQDPYNVVYRKDGSVEIWWGSEDTRENGQLSNLAPRKVKYNGVEYKSVESAFQAQKINYTSMTEDQKKIYALGFEGLDGKAANERGGEIPMLNQEEWNKNKRRIMKEILLASFEQNEKDRKMLLSTKDAPLTHNHAGKKKEWRTLFPEILTEVRSELLETYKDEIKEKPASKKKVKEKSEKSKQNEKEDNGPINVYEELPDLKNTTVRQFVYKGQKFQSVFQAYNIADMLTMQGISNETKQRYMQEFLRTTDVVKIKAIRSEVNNIKGATRVITSEQRDALLEELMYLSISQDDDAIELLLSTGDRELTGKQADKLTNIRERLKKEQEEQDRTDDEDHDDGPEGFCTTKNE